jgi:hypothetical protein
VALCFQLAADDFLQLQYLGSCRAKKWECGTDLFHRIPCEEVTEAAGHQCSLSLAQEVLDFLCLASPGYLELLQPAVSGSHLLKLPIHQLLLPFCQPLLHVHQLFLPRVQAYVPDLGGELTGQHPSVGLFQVLPLPQLQLLLYHSLLPLRSSYRLMVTLA